MLDRELTRQMGRECLAFRVRRASRVLSRLYDQHLAAVGLSSTQLTVLCAVANRPDLTMTELAEVLGFEQSSFSRAVALLVRKKWLRSVPSKSRRERFFALTRAGERKVRDAYRPWLDAQTLARGALAGDKLEALARLEL